MIFKNETPNLIEGGISLGGISEDGSLGVNSDDLARGNALLDLHGDSGGRSSGSRSHDDIVDLNAKMVHFYYYFEEILRKSWKNMTKQEIKLGYLVIHGIKDLLGGLLVVSHWVAQVSVLIEHDRAGNLGLKIEL